MQTSNSAPHLICESLHEYDAQSEVKKIMSGISKASRQLLNQALHQKGKVWKTLTWEEKSTQPGASESPHQKAIWRVV